MRHPHPHRHAHARSRRRSVHAAGSHPVPIERHPMRTLVLNAGYEPLAVVSFKRALLLVMNQKATVILHEEGNPVCAASGSWQRPSVILLTRYVRTPRVHSVPVSRRGVLRRDEHRCAYCGRSAATIDHVLPRSRGGREPGRVLPSVQQHEGRPHSCRDGVAAAIHSADAAGPQLGRARLRATAPAVGRISRDSRMILP
jgi:hypothetical protein